MSHPWKILLSTIMLLCRWTVASSSSNALVGDRASFPMRSDPFSGMTQQASTATMRTRRRAAEAKPLPQFETLALYQPATLITDYAALDLDIQLMKNLLAINTNESLAQARAVYEQGAFSMPFADLTLASPLKSEVAHGTPIQGYDEDSNKVQGLAMGSNANGTELRVLYDISKNQSSYVNCQVGANPNPNLKGCFAASFQVEIQGVSELQTYSYNRTVDNKNLRTIQGLSSTASTKMKPCDPCNYYHPFGKFVQYYNTPRYADAWIETALAGTRANFRSGSATFEQYSPAARALVATKAAAYMTLVMYAIRQMEYAVHMCDTVCPATGCDSTATNMVDSAWAFYAGSLEGRDGSGNGMLLFDLAETECINFGTCTAITNPTTSGSTGSWLGGHKASLLNVSQVNAEMLQQFQQMQANMTARDCVGARRNMERIERLMMVPLIQGTLRVAYLRSHFANHKTDVDEAEGAVLAGSILPWIATCDPSAADVLYQNMKTASGRPPNFDAVKTSLERVYECLGLTCADIGAYGRSQPCGVPQEDPKLSKGGISGVSVASFLVLMFGLYWLYRRRRRLAARKAARQANARDDSDDSDDDDSDDDALSDVSDDDDPVHRHRFN